MSLDMVYWLFSILLAGYVMPQLVYFSCYSSLYLFIVPNTALCYLGYVYFILVLVLARAFGVPVGRRSGGRLAMTLVATINVIIFFLFSFLFFFLFSFSSPSSTFLIQSPSAILGPTGGHFGFCKIKANSAQQA